MDSNSENKLKEALAVLNSTGQSYMLIVEDEQGVAIFSNGKGDRLFVVGKED